MPKNGTVETVATVPGVRKLQKLARNYTENLRNYMENLRNYMEKLQELYGESHGLYWNALTAWQISIFKFACPLNIFNYTPLWSKHHFPAHGVRQFCGWGWTKTAPCRLWKLETLNFQLWPSDLTCCFLSLTWILNHITTSPHHHHQQQHHQHHQHQHHQHQQIIIIIIILVLVLILTLILIPSSWSSSSSLLMALPHMSHRSQVVTNCAAIMSVANGQKLITEASSQFRRVQPSSILDEMLLVIVRCMSSMLSVPHSASEVVSYHNLCDLLRYFIQLM